MAGYDFAAIEKKWQAYWDQAGTFRQPNPGDKDFVVGPKLYVLDMFPYPSAAGLHVGHPEGYTATDIVARYARMNGYNVLHPMGYDSFGLPAQQYAVEHGIHPRVTTERNIANIERQIKMLGFSYDWSRRVATTDPDYYRWTQWIFLKLYNSWFDPDAKAARPIAELERKLLSGQFVVGLDGSAVPAVAAKRIADIDLYGLQFGQMKFSELEPDQQRRLIDEYRLAYIAEVPVNWCPMLGTVLANEEVTNEGKSDRGNFPVYRRALKQWMLRITAYAQRLEDDLALVDWPESIKIMQRNWIGRSVGAEVKFTLASEGLAKPETRSNLKGLAQVAVLAATNIPVGKWSEPETSDGITVYTTRPDTLYGATYMVLAPEHEMVEQITTPAQAEAVKAYVAAARKSELERAADTKEKTGVFTGAYAVNPVNQQPIPIWVADYVMTGYGTGAIMAVPAHDTRDFEFATKFNLPIVQVVQPPEGVDWHGYTDDGIAVNSGPYNGLPTAQFKTKITEDLAKDRLGKAAVNYKLRDWIFSRQWYWGEPFPIVHCERCGTVPLPEDQLPLLLPDMEDFRPHASEDPDVPPQPPLGRAKEWAATTCPSCGEKAVRELNAMPQWAGSCWYYLRYLDPHNDQAFVDPKVEKYWMNPQAKGGRGADAHKLQAPMGADLYVGGAEHAVLHLLYARFWHKVLYDLGHISTPEPFGRLFNQGMITSFTYRDRRGMSIPYDKIDLSSEKPTVKETGEVLNVSIEKMSKSQKNVINPDEVVAEYGADTLRLYEMFMGPLEGAKPWNTRDVPGVHRFLNRAWRMVAGDDERPGMITAEANAEVERALNRLIKKVGEDIAAMKFNTAIAAMMECVNGVYKAGTLSTDQAQRFLLVLAPFAPHIAEELWQRLGHDQSLAREPWPSFDPSLIIEDTVELPVQVNGKLRARVQVPAGADQAAILDAAMADPKVVAALEGKTVVKKIVVPNKLINFVVK